MNRICQLQSYDSAVQKYPYRKRIRKIIARKLFEYLSDGELKLVVVHPPRDAGNENKVRPSIARLHLQEGELVQVKSADAIRATLDDEGKYKGLAFTVAQERYCEQRFRVFKRVEHMFDERNWKLSRIRSTVLLEGVYCDGGGGIHKEWDGCDRRCFLFWKEGWLERVGEK